MADRLVLTVEAHDRLVAHVRAALPHEAVGLIGGDPAGRVVVVFPLPNLAGRRACLANPRAQYEAELELKRRRMPVMAVYHSHPGGTATLSSMDRHLASRTVAFQLVVAVGSPPQYQIMMRAYDYGGRPAVIILAT